MSLDFLLTWGCVLPKFGPPDVAFLVSTLPFFQCIADMDINNTQCETTSKSPNQALISMFFSVLQLLTTLGTSGFKAFLSLGRLEKANLAGKL